MPTELEHLDKHRSQVSTRSGPVSYIDTGGPGRAALFVHGLGTSSYLWRHVIDQLDGQRRCVAVDLPLHGQTPAAADQDFSLPGLADFVAGCCDALELDRRRSRRERHRRRRRAGVRGRPPRAAAHPDPDQLRSPHNVPPTSLLPAVLLARLGPDRPHRAAAAGTRHPRGAASACTAAATRTSPTCPTTSRAPGWSRARHRRRRPASTSACCALPARPRPAGDRTRPGPPAGPDAHRLGHRATASSAASGPTGCATPSPAPPRSSRSTGARLFFPDERATEFTAALRRHWDAHP